MKTDHLADFNWTFITTPEGWTHCYDPDGVQKCGSLNSKKKPCSQTILYDTGRCNSHQKGASNKRGFEHPNTTTGLTSKFLTRLPSKYSQQYQDLLQSAELLSLNEDIALHDLMVQDLLPRLHSGDLGQLWNDLANTFNEAEADMRIALRGQDPEALQRFIANFKLIGDFVRTGRRDWITRKEIMDVVDHKRALIKTVSDVEYKGENAITMADFLNVLEILENIFFKAIEKPTKEEMKQAYAENVQKIINFEDVS